MIRTTLAALAATAVQVPAAPGPETVTLELYEYVAPPAAAAGAGPASDPFLGQKVRTLANSGMLRPFRITLPAGNGTARAEAVVRGSGLPPAGPSATGPALSISTGVETWQVDAATSGGRIDVSVGIRTSVGMAGPTGYRRTGGGRTTVRAQGDLARDPVFAVDYVVSGSRRTLVGMVARD